MIFTLFYCLLDLSCGECNVISLYVLCCTTLLGVAVIVLLNVMEGLSVSGGTLLDRSCIVF